MSELEPVEDVAPLAAGTFAAYSDGDGGIVLVVESNGAVSRRHINKRLVKMGQKMMGGLLGKGGTDG